MHPPPHTLPVVYTGGLIYTFQQVCGAARSQHDCRPQARRLCPRRCGEPLAPWLPVLKQVCIYTILKIYLSEFGNIFAPPPFLLCCVQTDKGHLLFLRLSYEKREEAGERASLTTREHGM